MISDVVSGQGGATLVWLHSNGMCGESYRSLAQRLAAFGHTSILVDIPGFGWAPALATPGWEPLLGALHEALRPHLSGDHVLIGHSLGGLIAVNLAPRLRSSGLVLMEPAIIPWRWLARWAGARYVHRVFGSDNVDFRNRGPWYWRLHSPSTYPEPAMQLVLRTHQQVDRVAVASLLGDLDSVYPLPFAHLTMPTLLVRGQSSGPVMHLGQRDLARRLPNAELASIPRAGHWMVHEADDALVSTFQTWLASADPGAP